MNTENLYTVLGVSKNASMQEIKKAYRQLAKKLHPDACQDDSTKASDESRFKTVADAYAILSDSEKRARYDNFGHASGSQRFDDLLQNFMAAFSTAQQPAASAEAGEDLSYDLTISFENAVLGHETTIAERWPTKCSDCHGAGTTSRSSATCPKCHGTGAELRAHGFFRITVSCSLCFGTGADPKDVCKECHGSGRVKKRRKLKLKIPAGAYDGMTLRLRGEGAPSSDDSLPAGDLYVVLHVSPHKSLRRDGTTLIDKLEVTIIEAALGTTKVVETLTGRHEVVIPAGLQNGEEVRVSGAGVVDFRSGTQGDFLFIMRVLVPTRLSTAQRALLEEFGALTEARKHDGSGA